MKRLKLKNPLILCLALLVSACVSDSLPNNQAPKSSIAMIGVTIAPGVQAGAGQAAMGRDFQDLIYTTSGRQTLRSTEVNRAMNSVVPRSYQSMLDNYARTGQLHPSDLQALVGARLPVRTALIARVEKNEVKPGAPKRVALRNNLGDILTDRERVVLSTVREMRLQATMIDVSNGNVVWSRTYRSSPSTEAGYTHYSGSSFSGSLAASLANTMTNGLRVPKGPPPPSNQLTLRSLMREVVRNLP